jgi:hypothetical protein
MPRVSASGWRREPISALAGGSDLVRWPSEAAVRVGQGAALLLELAKEVRL